MRRMCRCGGFDARLECTGADRHNHVVSTRAPRDKCRVTTPRTDPYHSPPPTCSISPRNVETTKSKSTSTTTPTAMPPANLTTLLSSLRAPIFNTAAVSSNARTGAKYLRKRLRGPSVLNYIPTFPRLRDLNKNHVSNKYAGWEGLAAADQPGGLYQLPKSMVCAPGYEEIERREKPGPPIKQRVTVKTAGWVEDEAEYTRFDDVAKKRARGKGAPKKGESEPSSAARWRERGAWHVPHPRCLRLRLRWTEPHADPHPRPGQAFAAQGRQEEVVWLCELHESQLCAN